MLSFMVVRTVGTVFGWFAASGRVAESFAQDKTRDAKADGAVLPFPTTPSASIAGPTLSESTVKWRKEPERLKPGASNLMIVLIDDVGFGLPETLGGEVRTPTLSKLRDHGICYNALTPPQSARPPGHRCSPGATSRELATARSQNGRRTSTPVGGDLWTRFHPVNVITSPYTSWRFDATTTRMPEFSAAGLGKKSNRVTIELEVGKEASGVLYALGGARGGLTLYMEKGQLAYEYNMMIIEKYIAKTERKLAAGKHTIVVDTSIAKPGASGEVAITVDGKEVARTTVNRTVPAASKASETFDVGVDLSSPVSADYFERASFQFNGKIEKVVIELK